MVTRVLEAHSGPPAERIVLGPGDPVRIGEESAEYPGWFRVTTAAGVSSWIPDAYVRVRGTAGVALVPYDSVELTARVGDDVTPLREILGWAWCRAADGREGWLPLEKLERIAESAA